MILQKVKAVLLFIFNLVKRSLCCLRRRRKSSVDVVPLTDVGVVSNSYKDANGEDMVNWNSWDDPNQPKPPQTVEEHIQYYRNHRMGKNEVVQPQQPDVDFFQDMEPTIKKQKKLMMMPKDSDTGNRLAFNPTDDVVLPDDSGELKSWEETENREGYWDPGDWNTNDILRAKRKEEARKKAMEKKHSKLSTHS